MTYFPRFLQTIILRRTLRDVVELGGNREKYVVGQEIPRQNIYIVQLSGNAAERSNYKRLFDIYAPDIVTRGKKRGGTSGSDAGGVNWRIMRLLCLASTSTTLLGLVENFSESGVKKLKEWSSGKDAGLTILLKAACTDWNFDPNSIANLPHHYQKEGGTSRSDAGGIEWRIVCLLCLASTSAALLGLVENFSESGATRIAAGLVEILNHWDAPVMRWI